MKKQQKTASINFDIHLDDNNIPEKIKWHATDGGNKINDAKAIMLSIWDGVDKSSLKIDLWTKDMMAEEMKFFIFQILDSLSDNYLKSIGDEKVAGEIKKFAKKIGKISNVLK
ncbi:MAG: gliding motility protein GldC [Flavobacteriales bacterium]|nr:gliding motility protein GldC [Flavobacteriales bacterium]|tara:strand:- start:12317 stop:12655 length:339 start_codon:yes stop_codon:yes gene_type:complete